MTNRRGLHVWCDTTTLYTQLLRGYVEAGGDHGAEIVASGILRIHPLGFLRQLATFRAGGSRSAVARAAAIVRFDVLFLGHLWEVYGLHRLYGRFTPWKKMGRTEPPDGDSGGSRRGGG
jgi:cholesterol oxidase